MSTPCSLEITGFFSSRIFLIMPNPSCDNPVLVIKCGTASFHSKYRYGTSITIILLCPTHSNSFLAKFPRNVQRLFRLKSFVINTAYPVSSSIDSTELSSTVIGSISTLGFSLCQVTSLHSKEIMAHRVYCVSGTRCLEIRSPRFSTWLKSRPFRHTAQIK